MTAPKAVALPLGDTPRIKFENGAGEESRTPDLLITNQLLYQLSYTSAVFHLRNGVKRGTRTLDLRLMRPAL
jgi:hypothetical protein